MDYYLKFDTEAQANAVLYTLIPTEWDNTDLENPVAIEWESRSNYRNIDTIGVIYKGGEWNDEGEVITEPVALDGWHVNIRLVDGENSEPLEAYTVEPETPVRIWS